MFRYVLLLSVITFGVCYATNCQHLQQTQLSSVASLNERMSQMLNALYSSPLLPTCTKAKSTNTTPSTHTAGVTPTSEYRSATLTSSTPSVLTSPAQFCSYAGLSTLPYPNTAPNFQVAFTTSTPGAPSPTVAVTSTINSNPTSGSYSTIPQIAMSPGDYQYQNMPNTNQAISVEPMSHENQYKFEVPTPQQYVPQMPKSYSNQMNLNPMPVQYITPNNPTNAPKHYGFSSPYPSPNFQNRSPQSSIPIGVPAHPVVPQNSYAGVSTGADYNGGIVTHSASGAVPSGLPHPIPKSHVPTYPLPGHQIYPAHCNSSPNNPPVAYPVQTSPYVGPQDAPVVMPYYVEN